MQTEAQRARIIEDDYTRRQEAYWGGEPDQDDMNDTTTPRPVRPPAGMSASESAAESWGVVDLCNDKEQQQ
jgi:hypothetical protein